MQDHDLITGIIPSEKKTIFFALKESEHLFCFTTNNEVYSLENVNKSIELQTEDGFLIGKTHNNHQIAIYVGSKTFLILNARYLRTSTYVISKSNVNETSLEKFGGIKFVGGTLNRLFGRNSMEREYIENGLQVKAYDDTRTYIVNIKFWTLPAAEKICALFHKYDEEMLILNQSAIIIDDDAIKAFVIYRNDITHGSHRVLDVKIAITAHCLAGLVYCCLLGRIGVERSRILEWCKDKILR